MIYELMGKKNDKSDVIYYLQCFWRGCNEDCIFVIDLSDLYMLGPSASSTFVESVTEFADEREKPVILVNVHSEALKGLRICEYTVQKKPTLWAFDTDRKLHVIGDIPERWRRVLAGLNQRGQATASDLAEDSSKTSVNRFSVYLQELFNARLVIRDKVSGSERPGGSERGWTYAYRPAFAEVDVRCGE